MPTFTPDDSLPLLLQGRPALARAAFGPALTPQQQPGEFLAAQSEPPPPDPLAGRAWLAPRGLAQPPSCPTEPVLARREEPPPDAGRAFAARPPFDNRPGPRPVLARGDSPPPEGGRAVAGAFGFGAPRTPARVLVSQPEVRAPAPVLLQPGLALAAVPPAPALARQQPPGLARSFAAEPPPPFPGESWVRQGPLVPSERRVLRPVLSAREEPPPAGGGAVFARGAVDNPPPRVCRVVRPADPPPELVQQTALVRAGMPASQPFGRPLVARPEPPPPPPGAFLALAARIFSQPPGRPAQARAEDPPPFPGRASAAKPPAVPLVRQQPPGRAAIFQPEEPPPFAGRVVVLTGRAAGAVPPPLPVAKPGGVFRRADAGSRVFRRLPRMGATLTYQTRVKAPGEVLAVVFDFTNFPEVVAGATVASAAVSGAGGVPLAGLSAGPPAVLAAAEVIDSLGNAVAAGKGVRVALSGGAAGDDVVVECSATLSTGSVAVVQGKVAVRNAQ